MDHHVQRAGSRRFRRCRVATRVAAFLLASIAAVSAWAAVPPSGFQDTVVFGGLTQPTAVRFAPDGRVFVAEKAGVIKVFDGIADSTPDVLADLSVNVHNYWDRGLLGLAIDPAFPVRPYVYVLYTYDFDPSTPQIPAPRWGDSCSDPPGGTRDGCVATGRLSRLLVGPSNTLIGAEQVILENNWCVQFVTHSVGDLRFDDEGALLVSAGDGANFEVDYGQWGGSASSPIPRNPCGDPPGGRGGSMSPPLAEGGALRAQDLRSSGDPVTFDGSILRIDPDSGAAWPDNPLVGGDPADDRIVAYGLRNPFRLTFRPGTDEMWVGDVGWDATEEINRIPSLHGPAQNFGWPCYEGSGRQAAYDAANLSLCESLYAAAPPATRAPYFEYPHGQPIVPGDDCGSGSSAVSGLAFYGQAGYPSTFHGALFFADYGRGCIYTMPLGANGDPDPAQTAPFVRYAGSPVDLQIGPNGDLFYADIYYGEVRRVSYAGGNTPPTAVAQASPTSGPAPLTVQFDGSASSDPDPGASLTYEWDLDGDGAFDDSTLASPSYVYAVPGSIVVRLRVQDGQGGSGTAAVVVSSGNTAPVPAIISPTPSVAWRVGDVIAFSGTGTDAEDGTIPPTSMHWDIVLHHCPGGTSQCHGHTVQQLDGSASGTFSAPDHDWSAYLEFRLRVTDSGGLSSSASVSIQPRSVLYRFTSNPPGLTLAVGGVARSTPFDRPAIVGSSLTISAPSPQPVGSDVYLWNSWTDGGAATHGVTVGETLATIGATFSTEKILVVSAHPDDDVLSASGVIQRAVQRGAPVKIAYVTNGDLAGGPAVGLAREAEAVGALSVLGVPESDLMFLGYPDGSLEALRLEYPDPTDQFTTAYGQSATYGNRGLGGTDYHTYRFGGPAAYNAHHLVQDLTDVIDSFRPTHILTLSEWDGYTDHSATYFFVSEALGAVYVLDPQYAPTLHTTIIWADPPGQTPVWPSGIDPTVEFTEVPNLDATNLLWSRRESLDVPLPMQSTDFATNPKYRAIDRHVSQGGAGLFFGRFVHKDEFFWTENALGPNQPPTPSAGADVRVGHGSFVRLDASGSRDPEGLPLGFGWRQTSGPAVILSSTSAARPTFVAPVSAQSEVLTFELVASDGTFASLPDSVSVYVDGAENVARLSSASASSESVGSGQVAAKAVDGVPTGYPVDYTREWATDGQRAGAWIRLSWWRPYCVDRVVLYDRPNLADQILAGTLQFSDASTLAVGPLDDAGIGTGYTFPPKVITSVQLTVDQVSATTENVGLAEFEAYRCVEPDFDNDDWFLSEGDCDDSDGSVHHAPGEARDLRVGRGTEGTRLVWSSQTIAAGSSTGYDVVTGTLAELRADGGFARAGCLGAEVSTNLASDPGPEPQTGQVRYYLVRARNSCGTGTFGDARMSPDPRDGLDATAGCTSLGRVPSTERRESRGLRRLDRQ